MVEVLRVKEKIKLENNYERWKIKILRQLTKSDAQIEENMSTLNLLEQAYFQGTNGDGLNVEVTILQPQNKEKLGTLGGVHSLINKINSQECQDLIKLKFQIQARTPQQLIILNSPLHFFQTVQTQKWRKQKKTLLYYWSIFRFPSKFLAFLLRLMEVLVFFQNKRPIQQYLCTSGMVRIFRYNKFELLHDQIHWHHVNNSLVKQQSQSQPIIYWFSIKKIDNYLNMFLSSNNQIRNQIADARSAFRPTSLQPNYIEFNEKMNSFNSKSALPIFSNQLFPLNAQKERPHDVQVWSRAQIERLFKLYDYYGPQWKIMSQHMPLRTANNLKNRFYTVLRNLIKLLFRKKAESCPKLPGEIPSKDLSRLYDGKQDYKQFKNLVASILDQLSFNLESENIDNVVKNYSNQIVKVYQTIYGERAITAQQGSQTKIDKICVKQEDKGNTFSFSSCPAVKEQARDNLRIECPEPRRLEINQKGIQNDQMGYICFFFYNPVDFFAGQAGF